MRRGIRKHEPQRGVLSEVFGGALAPREGEDLGEERKEGGMNYQDFTSFQLLRIAALVILCLSCFICGRILERADAPICIAKDNK